MKSRTAWRAKLEKPQLLKIVDDPQGRGKMLIPRPIDVDALVRRVPRGKLITLDQLRQKLAKDCQADITCPLTTGIFLRIVAETAEEDRSRGVADIAPYWRVIRADGTLNDKYPGGVEAQASRLLEEGHSIQAGKKPRVKNFEKVLYKL